MIFNKVVTVGLAVLASCNAQYAKVAFFSKESYEYGIQPICLMSNQIVEWYARDGVDGITEEAFVSGCHVEEPSKEPCDPKVCTTPLQYVIQVYTFKSTGRSVVNDIYEAKTWTPYVGSAKKNGMRGWAGTRLKNLSNKVSGWSKEQSVSELEVKILATGLGVPSNYEAKDIRPICIQAPLTFKSLTLDKTNEIRYRYTVLGCPIFKILEEVNCNDANVSCANPDRYQVDLTRSTTRDAVTINEITKLSVL